MVVFPNPQTQLIIAFPVWNYNYLPLGLVQGHILAHKVAKELIKLLFSVDLSFGEQFNSIVNQLLNTHIHMLVVHLTKHFNNATAHFRLSRQNGVPVFPHKGLPVFKILWFVFHEGYRENVGWRLVRSLKSSSIHAIHDLVAVIPCDEISSEQNIC